MAKTVIIAIVVFAVVMWATVAGLILLHQHRYFAEMKKRTALQAQYYDRMLDVGESHGVFIVPDKKGDK